MNISLIYIIFISQTTMTINYEKRKNTELFTAFASKELTNLSNMQNYIPIYQRFFSLNETNYNSINMDCRIVEVACGYIIHTRNF